MKDWEVNSEKEDLIRERVLLVGVDLSEGGVGDEDEFRYSMGELAELAKDCFMEPVGQVTQKMAFLNKGL